jgi:undecaprenyl phosphate N,N'-diacetylbacillosamine 1-phosphate transferase
MKHMTNNLQAANSYKLLFKRAFDILVVGLCSILFIPVFLILALLVKLRLGGPVLFCQERAGLGGRPFKLIKFRIMRNAVDAKGNILPDAERLTSFGKCTHMCGFA